MRFMHTEFLFCLGDPLVHHWRLSFKNFFNIFYLFIEKQLIKGAHRLSVQLNELLRIICPCNHTQIKTQNISHIPHPEVPYLPVQAPFPTKVPTVLTTVVPDCFGDPGT